MRRLVWFVLLEGLWLLLVGTRQTTEVVAGLFAAALGVGFVELLRSLGLLAFEPDRLLLKVVSLLWQLPVEFGVITWALADAVVHGQRVRGRWLHVAFPTATGESGRSQRAVAGTLGTASPNGIVVNLDRRRALLHSLAPDLPGGRRVV